MPNLHSLLENPEAGNHPLPVDEREIEAVLRAGRQCFVLHPYYPERYGLRGEAFTRSDGGYLLTLADHPQSYVTNQVLWLAGVLASRGMPRWLMEVHLDLLCDEASAAVPARVRQYHKLRQAARVLRDARRAKISQRRFDTLADAFAAAAGPGLANVGGLLVAAVCDEACGFDQAVPSLTHWLLQPGRFSAQWCVAVAETLLRARSLAAKNPAKSS
jgi:hypothetical protein